MAYPTVSGPYGLKPVNLIGGQVFAGATRQIPITTSTVNLATAIFYGDVVTLLAAGTVAASPLAADATPLAGVVGVFLGCSYTNASTNQPTFAQYWPGAASGITDAVAYIADDPDQLFQVASVGATANGSGLVIAAVARTMIGTNATLVLNTGSTTSGDSKVGVYSNGVITSLPVRIVAGVDETKVAGNFAELIVKLNFGYHSYNNAAGV